MKLIPRQKIWLTIVVVTNLLLWLIPSDVVELIARGHQTLLGRYSRQHFTWIVLATFISVITLYIDWSVGETYKRRWFQVIAVLLFAGPSLLVFDFLSRDPAKAHYIHDHLAFHRPSGAEIPVTYEDKPVAYRTYPNAPAGYPVFSFTGHTDMRGYRNRVDLEQYDVVVLGDSFAAGTRMPDEALWPAQLAEKTGLSVYNLGMSGYAPLHYLASLKRYGLDLKPQTVLCLLYEGNDFRSAKADHKQMKPSLSKRINKYFKQSPLLTGPDTFFVNTFGPINRTGSVAGIEILDWMPLSVPSGINANHYAFAPKQLRDLYRYDQQEFAIDCHWLAPRGLLKEMNKLCQESGATLVIIYAPTKAHVMLPLVADSLPADHVRAFTQLSVKHSLPEPNVFMGELLERIEARETVVRQWCQKEGIDFIGTTEALREATLSGTQTYFTYDQHWTPDAHEVIAGTIQQYFADHAIDQNLNRAASTLP